MTSKTKSLMLAFGLLAAGTSLAAAADWNTGPTTIKPYRNSAAVPVPAPAPIPVYAAEWYVRADLNFAAVSGGSVGYEGPALNLKSPEDMPRYFGGSVAVGRYLTPSIRADLSVDYRSRQRLASGTSTVDRAQVVMYNENVTNNGLTGVRQVTDTRRWTDSYTNEASIGHYAAMINAYYDFRNSSAFTPYVGAGIGIAMHELSRTSSDSHLCRATDRYTSPVPSIGLSDTAYQTTCSASLAGVSNAKDVTTGYGLAAALMAGVSYEVSPGVLWDSGYRFMYFNGSVAQTSNTGLSASMIKIGERTDHEFRTGIRLNID